jgi:hypothetical protein
MHSYNHGLRNKPLSMLQANRKEATGDVGVLKSNEKH